MFENLIGKKNFSIDRLATLCHIAESGSIGAASGENSNKQSLYSRQISELEKFLGTALLDRNSKPYGLTERGCELSRISRNYLSAMDDFIASCQEQPSRLVVGAGESLIQWLLIPSALPKFRQQIPKVKVIFKNLQTEQIVEALQNGEIDLGLVRKNAIPKALKAAGSFQQKHKLFIPKKFHAKLKSPVELDQIAKFPMAVLEGSGELRRSLDRLAEHNGVDLHIQIECSSLTQVALLVARKECCAILPSFARSHLDRSSINDLEVKGFRRHQRNLCIAWNPKRSEIRPIIEDAARILSE